MLIYYILILMIIIPGLCSGSVFQCNNNFLLNGVYDEKKMHSFRKYYTIYCGILVFLVSAFRDFSVGTDIASYIKNYLALTTSFDEIEWSIKTEIGFLLYNVLLKKLCVSARMYIIITSAFFTYVFSRFIYKFSNNIGLGFLIHITIGLFAMSFSGIRQTFAICFILLAFEQIKNKKLIKFIVLWIIAVSFHYSAIIMLPLCFINKVGIVKKNKSILKQIFVPFVMIAFYFLIQDSLLEIMKQLSLKDYFYSGYFDNLNLRMNVLVYLFAIGVFFVCLICNLIGNDIATEHNRQWGIIATMFLITTLMSSIIYMASRLSYYFLSFFVVMLPNSIALVPKKYNFIFIFGLIIICISYFIIVIPGNSLAIDRYFFFWEV